MKLSMKKIRIEKGLTQEMLSDISGVNRVNICDYENGKSGMTLETACKLAKALGCTVDDLLKEA